MSDGSRCITGVGNTSRPPLSKHWCFTLNNYRKSDIPLLQKCFGSLGTYIFQEERGESGTPHLQGYVCFNKRKRPLEIPGLKELGIHWERTRSPKHAIEYCRKAETRCGGQFTNMVFDEEIRTVKHEDMQDWQKDVLSIVDTPPHSRKVYWLYDEQGNCGKTEITKYLVVHRHALALGGRAGDLKHGCIAFKEKNGFSARLIIFDVPRCCKDYISYQGIEETKNGLFFSGKYESTMYVSNPPHLICFANKPPDIGKLSLDRWDIREIKRGKLIDRTADLLDEYEVRKQPLNKQYM